MSVKLSRELLSVITSVITEICDDSDDEDPLPYEAFLESRAGAKVETSEDEVEKIIEPPAKKSKTDPFKHIRPARFEDVTYIYYSEYSLKSNDQDIGSTCEITLKPTSLCVCPNHYSENYTIQLKISLDSFTEYFTMKQSTIEVIYSLFHSDLSEKKALIPSMFLAVLAVAIARESSERFIDHSRMNLAEIFLGLRAVKAYELYSRTTPLPLHFHWLGFTLKCVLLQANVPLMKKVAERFEVSVGDLAMRERDFYDSFLKKRFHFERWPVDQIVPTTADGFEKICGIPGVIGVINQVYFRCDGQPYSGTYRGPNNETSIVFEVACDHRGSFIYSSYFWWPGKLSPQEILLQSRIHDLPAPEGSYLIGSHTYYKIKGVLTPYEDVGKNECAANFNEAHDLAMDVLRNSILSLVSRFGTLSCVKMLPGWCVRKQMAALQVLHNICIDLDDIISPSTDLHPESFFPPPFMNFADPVEHHARDSIAQDIPI